MKSELQYEELKSLIRDEGDAASTSPPCTGPFTGVYDIVCIGFGPAAVSIAIALRERDERARVLFLERQARFGWHCGMLLPGSRMQISFIKDLAALRNPRSHFTFLNYLRHQNRIVEFTNLSTTLPLREEFNDYMSWCASYFNDWVEYGQEALAIEPGSHEKMPGIPIRNFKIQVRDMATQGIQTLVTKNVIMASGRQPAIPFSYPRSLFCTKIIHSSAYMTLTPQLLRDRDHQYNLAVVGGGQSAAEIFNELSLNYPRARVTLISRASSLKPSDDSPFVNEIFHPSQVDRFFSLQSTARRALIQDNRLTNYGVVRLELLEHLYLQMYHQRITQPDESQWRLRMTFNKEITAADIEEATAEDENNQQRGNVQLQARDSLAGEEMTWPEKFHFVFVATGYSVSAHQAMLRPLRRLFVEGETCGFPETERNYRVKFHKDVVRRDAGIWLQGCCEQSHGLSDSLLSILAVRSGELIESIFSSRQETVDSVDEQRLLAKM